MTICVPKQADYLLRRIRAGEGKPVDLGPDGNRRGDDQATGLARFRDPHRDALGGDQSDVDFIARQPITAETAWVQVKSRSAEFEDYFGRFAGDGSCDRFISV